MLAHRCRGQIFFSEEGNTGFGPRYRMDELLCVDGPLNDNRVHIIRIAPERLPSFLVQIVCGVLYHVIFLMFVWSYWMVVFTPPGQRNVLVESCVIFRPFTWLKFSQPVL